MAAHIAAKGRTCPDPLCLPIDQRQRTSAWQRWTPRRKTANVYSGFVRGPALTEDRRLETCGQKMGIAGQPSLRRVLPRSARCKGSRNELTPVQHNTVGYSRLSVNWTGPVKTRAWSPHTLWVARPFAVRLRGTVHMRATVLWDGTARFPRAALGL